jgi:hypothetical protein
LQFPHNFLTSFHGLRYLQVQGAPHGKQAKQQVPTPNPDPLAGLAPPPANLPPGLSTLNLTQLAPLLPLLANINASVVATWVPVLEAVDATALGAWAPVLNLLSNTTVEAVMAALPTINVTKVLQILPAVNALNASMLEGYIKVMGQVRLSYCQEDLSSLQVLEQWECYALQQQLFNSHRSSSGQGVQPRSSPCHSLALPLQFVSSNDTPVCCLTSPSSCSATYHT